MLRRFFLQKLSALAAAPALLQASDAVDFRTARTFSAENVTFEIEDPENLVVRITGIHGGELHRRDFPNLWSYTTEYFDDFSTMGTPTPFLPVPRRRGEKDTEGVDLFDIDLEIHPSWKIEVGP